MKRLLLTGLLADKFYEITAALILAGGTGFITHILNRKESTVKNLKESEEAAKIRAEKDIIMSNFVVTQRDNLRKELELSISREEFLKNEVERLRGIILAKEKEGKEKDIRITFLEAHQAKF